MSIYVIGDLHLPFGIDKPMDIFGNQWEGYTEKIKEDWEKKVKPEDIVILAGDFSWATYLKDTYKDFEFLEQLPGKKIMLKGNHDYWWTTVKSMKEYLEKNKFKNIDFLHNNSFCIENKIIVGTRGWALTDTENSSKIIRREAQRLEFSIKDAMQNYGKEKEIICIMHYPPIINANKDNEFTRVMNKYNVKRCYYAHLHGKSHEEAIEGNVNGIEYKLVSGDYLDFKLIKLC